MVEVVPRVRRSAVLTPSKLPCLSNICTINITRGCASGCRYCYIQGYSDYPGPEQVIIYENTPDLVVSELRRRRCKPRRVYFSPSSDAFQDIAEVQELSYQTMSILLNAGVEVAFLTKGCIPECFLDLFDATATNVFAQVGITTLDRSLSEIIEPGGAWPARRLETIRRLTEIGVPTTARLDPLIPDVTDTKSNIEPLLAALGDAGIESVAASYLFIRPRLAPAIHRMLQDVSSGRVTTKDWERQQFLDGSGSGQMLPLEERSRRFATMRSWAERFGVVVNPCRCKNPEMGGPGCAIAGPMPIEQQPAYDQYTLDFGCD